MATWSSVSLPAEVGAELADELRRLFQELDRQGPLSPGECSPAIDVLETDETLEIVLDVPGVPPERLRVFARGDLVVIAGEKPSLPAAQEPGTYHLLERSFGRFARAVRLTRAVDGGRARAALTGGELRVVLPKIHDRRGSTRAIPVEQVTPSRDC